MSVITGLGAEQRHASLGSTARHLIPSFRELASAVMAGERVDVLLVKSCVISMREEFQVLEAVIAAVFVDVMEIRPLRMWFSVVKPPDHMGAKAVSKVVGARVVRSIDAKPTLVVEVPSIPIFGRPRLTQTNELSLLCSSHR